jgi:hypothetical protein
MAKDNECETCGGDGFLVEDTFINGRDGERKVPCHACQAGDDDDFDDSEPVDIQHDDGRGEPDPMKVWL